MAPPPSTRCGLGTAAAALAWIVAAWACSTLMHGMDPGNLVPPMPPKAGGRPSLTIPSGSPQVKVALSRDGRLLATGGGPSGAPVVRLWDAATGKLLLSLAGPKDFITAIAFSPDSSRIVAGSMDGHVYLWSTADGASERTIAAENAGVGPVAYAPGGSLIAVGGVDGTVRIYDASTGKLVRTVEFPKDPVEALAYSPDGSLLAVSCLVEPRVALLSTASWTTVRELKARAEDNFGSLAFSDDSELLGAGNWDQSTSVWRASTGTLLQTLKGQWAPIVAVAFIPGGHILATGGDYTVWIWDANTGKALYRIVPPDRGTDKNGGMVTSLAILPTGSAVAIGGFDGEVQVWPLKKRPKAHTPLGSP